jgi:hypothetical protein
MAGRPGPWAIETVCPATVTLPVRSELVGFAAIENWTLPGPVPFAAVTMEMNEADDEAVHWQDAGVDTLTVTVFAAPETVKFVLSSAYPHAACVIENV